MFVWEWKLKVRRAACEFRLFNLRVRHSALIEDRNRSPFKGPMWEKQSDKLALLRSYMYRELDEIKSVRQLAMIGPIKGGTVVLHVRDGKTHKVRPGPSLIQLIEREIESHSTTSDQIEQGMAEGLQVALDIINNPYKFLTDDEQASYDQAEIEAKRMTDAAGARGATSSNRPGGIKTAPTPQALRASGAQMMKRGSRSND